MRDFPLLASITCLMAVSWIPGSAPATELAPLSASELQEFCSAYASDPQSQAGAACVSYVRGYIEGSPKVRIVADATEGAGGDSFGERALRTRIGVRETPPASWCVPASTPVAQLVSRILQFVDEHRISDQAAASAVVEGMLHESYRCTAGVQGVKPRSY